LTAAVGGREAALVLTTVTAGKSLAIGDTDLLPALEDQAPPPDQLIVTSMDGGSLMLAVAREEAAFTALEREITQAGLAVVHPWLRETLQQLNEPERRRRFRPVDAVFEELAADAVQAGQHASVIVISIGAIEPPPGLLITWLGKIRGQLRSADFAGILSDSEVAVLLGDASADQAAAVSARLRQLIESDDSAGVFFQPAIGVVTSSPDSPFERSVVGAARAGARAAR
jgi:hypothetical protein